VKYTFTLEYRLSEIAGFDEALAGICHLEGIALKFSSANEDSTSAIIRALTEARRRIPAGTLIEVSVQPASERSMNLSI